MLAGTLPPDLADADNSAPEAAELAPFATWLREHRLNINVRQVYAHGARHGHALAERKRVRADDAV